MPVDPNVGEPWGRYSPRIHAGSPVSMPYALRQWRKFLHGLEEHAGAKLFWFYGLEYGEKFGRLHIHALTGNTERLPTQHITQLWPAGWARVLVYDPNKGAGWYVAKYVAPGHDLAEWDISDSPDQAAAWRRYRDSDRRQVEQLTRAAQARLRALAHAVRHAQPAEQQTTLFSTEHDHDGESSPAA